MNDERALIVRAIAGEHDALDALARKHRSGIYRTARHILGDDSRAEDVTQDVLVRLQTALPGFRGDAELGTWLYRVTVNRCKDLLRRRHHESLDDVSSGSAPALSVDSDPGAEVDRDRRAAAVREAIERLPDEQREVIVLRFLSDLSYAEIARVTRLPAGTVASRVFRGLKRLGEDLESRHLELLK